MYRRARWPSASRARKTHKMVWYKLGNQISDRQWGDIVGVLKVQGEALDHEYLDRWAPLLEVADLLLRVRRER